jgi:hypothetical protein
MNTMLKPVQAFKLSTGEICTDRITGLEKEYRIQLRGIIQRTTKNATLTASDAAGIMAANFEEINKVGNSFRNAIRRAKSAQKVTVPNNTMISS